MCRYTDWLESFGEYAVEIGLGAMMYALNFVNLDWTIQKFVAENIKASRQYGDRISRVFF
jgi:hypothetical protein